MWFRTIQYSELTWTPLNYKFYLKTASNRSRVSSIGIVTRLGAGRSGVQIPEGERNFPIFENHHTTPGDILACYSVGTGILSWGQSGWGVKLTTDLHIMSRLRTSGVKPLLPFICLHGMDGENFTFYPPQIVVGGVKLTIHHHPVPRLRMSGAVPLLPWRVHA
jgi:hypothetical protein